MSTATIELARHYLHDAPADAASLLEALPTQDSAAFLNHTPAKDTARLLLCLSPAVAANLLACMKTDAVSDVLALLNPNQIASLLRTITTDQQKSLLNLLPESRANSCHKLLQYPDGSIGAIALTEAPIFSNNLSVEECLERIKKQSFPEASMVFLNDNENRYLGAVQLSDLLLLPSKAKIDKLPRLNTIQLSGLTPLGTALGLDIWLQYEIVAVVDSKQFFVGSLSHQRLRRSAQQLGSAQPDMSPLLTELGNAFTASMLGLLNELHPSKL